MPTALAILVGAQLIGEILSRLLHLPLPGPVVGMFLLAVALVIRGGGAESEGPAAAGPLADTANALVANMGLLFVPAGVGVVAEMGIVRQEWLPLLAGMVVSTALSLVVTGLVMQRLSRKAEESVPTSPLTPSEEATP